MTTDLTDSTTPQYTLVDTLTGIEITWQGKKDWGRFASYAFSILLNLVVIGIILYYFSTGAYGELLSQTLTLVMVILLTVYMFYRLYRRLKDMTGALLAHEIIQINDQALTIRRSGFMNIQREVAYPADKIQSIRSMTSGVTRGLYPVFAVGGDALTRYQLGVDQVFCRGIDETDAMTVLGRIHERFPHYRYLKI
jgi:hypothetical protein